MRSVDIPLQQILDEKRYRHACQYMFDTVPLSYVSVFTRRSRLEEVVSEPGLGRTWLEPCARTSDGTSSFLKQLESRVNQDAFLYMLQTDGDGTCVPGSNGDERTASIQSGSDVLSSEWWLADTPSCSDDVEDKTVIGYAAREVDECDDGGVNDTTLAEYPKSHETDTRVDHRTKDHGTSFDKQKDDEESLGYVFVEHQDAVDAMAEFLAAYLITLPEAKAMDAIELQTVVKNSLREMQSSKRLHTVMAWGQMFVKTAAVGCGSLAAAYSNPWAVRAILKAIYTCFRFSQAFW